MLIAHLDHPETYRALLTHSVWEQALQWLKNESSSKDNGEYEIQGRDVYASVQSLTTLSRDEGVFEAHRNYIDIHYLVSGEEIIEWAPAETLTPTMEYDQEKDYCLYDVPADTVAIHYTPGLFGIYLPADAHMPKVAVSDSPQKIKKVVVKIAVNQIA